MDDLELWLPADLLTDEDIVNDFKTDRFAMASDLSSPSDEDRVIAELRAVLARSTIKDSDSSPTEGWKPPDSPQSTLCGYKSDYKGTADSSSPFYSTALFPPPPNPNSFFTTPNQYQMELQARISYHRRLHADQFQHMRQREIRRNGGRIKQPSSGLRAVFLGEPGEKLERKGTGVFMPRVTNSNLPETRKKPGCSAVLLPERVIHTLNLNVDSIEGHVQNHPITNGSFTSIYGVGNNN